MRYTLPLLSSLTIAACDLDPRADLSDPLADDARHATTSTALAADAAVPVVVDYPASPDTSARFGIVRWHLESEPDGPDFTLIGTKANGHAGFSCALWTSSNGNWLNYRNFAPRGPQLAMRIVGDPELWLEPTYAESPSKWDSDNAYHEAAKADRDRAARKVVAASSHADMASCAGNAFEFAATAFVTTLGSLAAPEACGATGGVGCEAAFSAAAYGWWQTGKAYSDYLSCLGF